MNPLSAPVSAQPSIISTGGGILTAAGTITGTAVLAASGGLTGTLSIGGSAARAAETSMFAGQGAQGAALLAAVAVLGASPSTGVSAQLAADSGLDSQGVNQINYTLSFM